jgi:hypothetical protein
MDHIYHAFLLLLFGLNNNLGASTIGQGITVQVYHFFQYISLKPAGHKAGACYNPSPWIKEII